jgi:N6-adenosine-specific RNA methylase IME4
MYLENDIPITGIEYMPFPDRRYSIIYADPPWTYRDKALAGSRGAGCKYSLMSMDDIADLPIGKIAAKDCALFLWTTFPKLEELFFNGLIRVWGFEYKTAGFVWVKRNRYKESWFFGMGNYTRSNVEVCLLATKGRLARLRADVHSVVDAPILRHSEKPHEVRERIVRLFGDLPRIELFARRIVPGWDAWGSDAMRNPDRIGLDDLFLPAIGG